MMFKSFKKCYYYDDSWTGGRVGYHSDCLEQLDRQIDIFATPRSLEVVKVDYSMVNENVQHGSAPHNTARRIHIIAGVQFRFKEK